MEYSMYVCPDCRKVFKVKGNDKKVKCTQCDNVLLKDLHEDVEAWKGYNKDKRDKLISDLLDEEEFEEAFEEIEELEPEPEPIKINKESNNSKESGNNGWGASGSYFGADGSLFDFMENNADNNQVANTDMFSNNFTSMDNFATANTVPTNIPPTKRTNTKKDNKNTKIILAIVISVAVFFFVIVLAIAVLSNNESGSSKKAEDPFSPSEQNAERAAVGTYIGEDGSVYSLLLDGTADYFFITDDEPTTGQLWTYTKNKKILIKYSDKTTISVDANSLDVEKYYFRGNNTAEWKDETYVKVTNEAKHLTGDECRTLLAAVIKAATSGGTTTNSNRDSGSNATSSRSNDNNETGESVGGVDPNLKAFLDSYEDFVDDYIAFMEKYEKSNDINAMLSDYTKMLNDMAEYDKALSQYDKDKMSKADYTYYVEVTTRCSAKLMKAAYQ